MSSDNLPVLIELSKKTVAELREWLDQYAELQCRHHNWWLGLASTAKSRSFDYQNIHPDEEAIQWAELALTIYENLANCNEKQGKAGISLMRHAMEVRANAINRFGYDPSRSLLNFRVIEMWFFKTLELTIPQVHEMASHTLHDLWETQQDMMVESRNTKNRIGVFMLLDDQYVDQMDPRIKEWLAIRQLLI